MRRVISLFLPSWPIDRLRRGGALPKNTSAKTEPPVLTAAREKSRRVVMAVDGSAAALGLRPGMAVTQAQAMVPGLTVLEADPVGDAAALARLAAWCLRFSPLTAQNPPDGIWIEAAGCAPLFGGEAAMLDEIVARLGMAGIAARAAIAGTPGAAHAVARYGAAARYAAPAVSPVVSVVPPGGEQTVLSPLSLAALRLPEEALQALRLLGFETIGQILAAPRAPLTRRLGAAVFHRLDQALGTIPEPIEPATPPQAPRSRMGFPEPIATPEDLARAASLLAEGLCKKLAQRGLGARRLDLLFRRVDGETLAIRVGTAAATREAAHLQRLLLARIEDIDPGFGIEAVCLTASATEALGARQTLSEMCAPGSGPDLACLIDTLINRLGPESVSRATPVESDVPERSVRRIGPLAKATGASWPPHLPRPPRLLRPPRPVEAMALLPDHAPAQFTWRRHAHRIHRADGPERIFGEWWKDEAETWSIRDYFRVEDEHGQRFWLFRNGDGEDPQTGELQWFIHGIG